MSVFLRRHVGLSALQKVVTERLIGDMVTKCNKQKLVPVQHIKSHIYQGFGFVASQPDGEATGGVRYRLSELFFLNVTRTIARHLRGSDLLRVLRVVERHEHGIESRHVGRSGSCRTKAIMMEVAQAVGL